MANWAWWTWAEWHRGKADVGQNRKQMRRPRGNDMPSAEHKKTVIVPKQIIWGRQYGQILSWPPSSNKFAVRLLRGLLTYAFQKRKVPHFLLSRPPWSYFDLRRPPRKAILFLEDNPHNKILNFSFNATCCLQPGCWLLLSGADGIGTEFSRVAGGLNNAQVLTKSES